MLLGNKNRTRTSNRILMQENNSNRSQLSLKEKQLKTLKGTTKNTKWWVITSNVAGVTSLQYTEIMIKLVKIRGVLLITRRESLINFVRHAQHHFILQTRNTEVNVLDVINNSKQ